MEEIIALAFPFILMAVVFYFLLIRPQQKRTRAINEMQANLKKGDHITTIGGLHGVINSLDENTLVLEVHNGQKLTYDRSAVKEIVEKE